MSFEYPWRLPVALLAILAVGWYLRYAARRRDAAALLYSNVAFVREAFSTSAWIVRMLVAAWIVSVALLALAVAGPRITLPVPVQQGSAVICIDTSGSMASTDIAPTRSAAATAAARAFIRRSPPGIRIGIVAFSSQAEVVQPLTSHHRRAIQALAQLPPPNGATAIGDALALAARMLPARGHRVIVLLTDGVNNTGVNPMAVAQRLGELHVPVYTIGIGTNSGAFIPGTGEPAQLDQGALRAYAQVSGGTYARASDAGELRGILSHLGGVTGFERRRVDASLAFALLAGFGMLASFLVGSFFGGYR
ncbi:MAG: vWA domain-containing protein [Vulcanimicrobiaceae bacterium]